MPRSFAGITRCSSMPRPLAKGSGSGAGGASRRAAATNNGVRTSSQPMLSPPRAVSRTPYPARARYQCERCCVRETDAEASLLFGADGVHAHVVPVARIVERADADLTPGERLVGRR